MNSVLLSSRPQLSAAASFDLSGTWQLLRGESDQYAQPPETVRWKEALAVSMPNSVQTALVEAGELPNPYFGKENLKLTETYHHAWWLRKVFELNEDLDGSSSALLFFEGIEYESRVWLNGRELGSHEGMFGGPVYEVTDALVLHGENELVIGLAPPPLPPVKDLFDSSLDPLYQSQGVFLSSAAKKDGEKIVRRYNDITGCGWAYPQSYTCGLWEKTRLVFNRRAYFLDAWSWTEDLSSDHSTAIIGYEAEICPLDECAACTLEVSLFAPESDKLLVSERQAIRLNGRGETIKGHVVVKNPPLWWPNGLGEQPLCQLRFRLVGEDEVTLTEHNQRIGIRKLERRATTGAATRYPWNFVVNGRDFFVRGFNWVPPDSLRKFDEEQYRHAVVGMAETNSNMIRIWGWGGSERELFYDLCDELGLFVSQEFPITQVKADDENLEVLKQQAEWIVRRIRSRPCVAQWSGGNELHNLYPEPSAPPLDFLEKFVPQLDPTRLHQRTSPYGGDIHYGQLALDDSLNTSAVTPIFHPIERQDEGEEIPLTAYGGDYFGWIDSGLGYDSSQPQNFAFVSETVFPTMLSEASLQKVVPEEELNTTVKNGADLGESHPCTRHHADLQRDWFPDLWVRALEFAPVQRMPLREALPYLQWPQAIRYQHLAGGYRANYPKTGGFQFWVFNTPWPIGTWEVMDYYGVPNTAYYLVKKMFAPVAVAARFSTVYLASGDQLEIDVHLLTDTPSEVDGLSVKLLLLDSKLSPCLQKEYPISEGLPQQANCLDVIKWDSSSTPDGMLTCVLEIPEQGASHRVVYPVRLAQELHDPAQRKRVSEVTTQGPPKSWTTWSNQFAIHTTILSLSCDGPRLCITNVGDQPAWPVSIRQPGREQELLSDNYFWLWPGEKKIVELTGSGTSSFADNTIVTAWNAAPITLAHQDKPSLSQV